MRLARTTLVGVMALTAIIQSAQAASPSRSIATFCNQTWSGNRNLQSFCIKEQDNYYDWIRYLRKHSATDPKRLSHLDECVAEHQPNYRNVFDCVQEGPSWLPFF